MHPGRIARSWTVVVTVLLVSAALAPVTRAQNAPAPQAAPADGPETATAAPAALGPTSPGQGIGRLEVTTDPPGAIVSLGTRGYKMSPATFSNLPVGPCEVTVKLTGYDVEVRTVDIVAGQVNRAHVALSKEGQRIKDARHPRAVLVSDGQTLGEFKTIGEAQRVAPAGARILLDPGDYYESVVLDKPVEIVGQGKREDIVIESKEGPCLVMKTGRATVRNVTFRGRPNNGTQAYTVDIPQGQLRLEECDVTSDSLAAVAIHGRSADPVLEKCIIKKGREAAVLFYNGAKGTLENCKVQVNSGVGVEILQGADPLLRECVIEDGLQAGILVDENGRGRIEECDIAFNRFAGIEIRGGGDPVVRGCDIFEGNGGGIYVHSGGKGTIEDCEIYGNSLAGIEIRDGGNPVIRNCKIHHGDQNGILVARDGKGLFEGCTIEFNHFAGVETRDGGDPTLRQCQIKNGFSAGFLAHAGGKGRVENCDIYFNGFSNVEVRQAGDPVLRDTQIHHGLEAGVLVHDGGKGQLEDCSVFANLSNGIEIRTGGEPLVRNCSINRNHYSGVRVHAKGRGRLEFCDLRQNISGPLLMKSGGLVQHQDLVY